MFKRRLAVQNALTGSKHGRLNAPETKLAVHRIIPIVFSYAEWKLCDGTSGKVPSDEFEIET